MRGKFIVLEGIDGSGKSTQAKKLSSWLETRTNMPTISTYEPNIFRELLLNHTLNELTEVLIFLADRSEHSSRIILPSLEAGKNVICERWNASTLAYQALPIVPNLISLCKFPIPDAEIYLDISPEEAFARIRKRGKFTDKYEAQGLSYLTEVLSRYREIANSQGMTIINCDVKSEEEIFTEIAGKIEAIICQSR